MNKVIVSVVGLICVYSAKADCVPEHFDKSIEAARHVLTADTTPRMAYITQKIVKDENPALALQLLCDRVADAMEKTMARQETLAFASVNSEAQMTVLRCLDDANQEFTFPLLRFVFIGRPANEDEARAIVEGWRSEFYFIPEPAVHGRSDSVCSKSGQNETS